MKIRSQLYWNFDAIHSLLFTKEYIDADFGILDAGTSLNTTIVTGLHTVVSYGASKSWVSHGKGSGI